MGIFYSIFGWLLGLCYQLVHNYALALLLFTLIAKILMLPLGLSQQKNTVKMQRMKPEMDKIRERYGRDQQKYSEELQKLYQRENYSATAGCLPMLLQFPIIIGLYGVVYKPLTYMLGYAQDALDRAAAALTAAGTTLPASDNQQFEIRLASAINKAGQAVEGVEGINFDLFGIIDLSQVPSIAEFNILWLIPLLAGVSAMLTSYISMKINGTEINGVSRVMIFGMPLISVAFAFTLPAAIGFYWTLSNILSVFQLIAVKKIYNPAWEERRIEKKRAAERAEKLERLRRIHGEDDEPADPAQETGGRGLVPTNKRGFVKDDPDADAPPEAPAEEEKPLSNTQRKKLEKERLRASREREQREAANGGAQQGGQTQTGKKKKK